MDKQVNTNKKHYPLIILILLAGMISACGATSSEEKAADGNDDAETTDCKLGSSSIGNCNL